MTADAGIYAQARPVTPLEGPLDSYAKMISVKSLMGNEQLNEMQRTKLSRDLQEEEAFKNLFAGATPEQMSAPDFLQRALAASPTRGIALQKSQLDQQKIKADLLKTTVETGAKALEMHRDELANVKTPQDAAAWVKSAYTNPALAPIAAHGGTLEQALATIPTDPAAFDQWKEQNSVGAAKLLELNQQRKTQAETGRHNRATEEAAARSNRIAQANLSIKGAEATPGGIFSIPDIVARATGGAGGAQPAPGMVTPAQLLSGGQNALNATPAAPAAPAQARPAQAALPTNPVQAAIASGKSGDELLKTLPPEVASQVKQMVEGRMAPPTSMALGKPYWQGMMQLANAYEPNFDETLWGSRNAARKSLAPGGKVRENLTNINTAIGHLDSLDKSAQALNNSDFPMINRVTNAVGPEAGATDLGTRLRKFQESRKAVADELMRVFRGGGSASEKEAADWANMINQSDSPAALRGAVQHAVELLESRIQAQNEAIKQGMGKDQEIDTLNMVYPKSRATLDRLKSGKPAGQTDAGKIGSGGIKFLGWEEKP